VRNVTNCPAQILVVDDEIHMRKLLELLLRADGYQTRSAASAGMLSAKAIAQLAGEAEAACANGDMARASPPLATRIAIQLQRLREAAVPAFLAGSA
jgi:CheY-like chemotaxis protein